ncbi:hypothetical protein GCM10028864_37930 [Microlunatus parietis]
MVRDRSSAELGPPRGLGSHGDRTAIGAAFGCGEWAEGQLDRIALALRVGPTVAPAKRVAPLGGERRCGSGVAASDSAPIDGIRGIHSGTVTAAARRAM